MDTVVLNISKDRYQIVRPDLFRPRFRSLDYQNRDERIAYMVENKGIRQFRQNPPAENRSRGVVLPNLTIIESVKPDNHRCDLKVSISLPKFLKGHSLWEMTEQYLPEIGERLEKSLLSMGVVVDKEHVTYAQVNNVHFCRNILLNSEEEARNLLSKLKQISLGGWYENHARDYANTGSTIRFHSDIFEFVVYLKYYDLFEPKSRCVDKKRTKQERELAKSNPERYKPMIRFECRINTPRSIRKHLFTCTGTDQPVWTLAELIDRKIERQVLFNYWNKLVTDPINRVILEHVDDLTLIRKIEEKYAKTETFDDIFAGIGKYHYIKTKGVNESRRSIISKSGRNKWNAVRGQIAKFMSKLANEPDPLLKHIENILVTGPIQYELQLD